MRLKKLPFPDFLLKTNCTVNINSDVISEEGEPVLNYSEGLKCIYNQKQKKIITPEGVRLDLSGVIILKGDINPNLKNISSGSIVIDEIKMNIYSCSRPRNPDGSVYSTNFEVY